MAKCCSGFMEGMRRRCAPASKMLGEGRVDAPLAFRSFFFNPFIMANKERSTFSFCSHVNSEMSTEEEDASGK